MPRANRDRDADRAHLRAATGRLLAGTPLRSVSGKLTVTELITESGLRRDIVYAHPDLVDDFKAHVKAQHFTPASVHDLASHHATLAEELSATKRALADERATATALRKALAEISLELLQAREELEGHRNVTRLPTAGPTTAERRRHDQWPRR